MCEGFKTTHQLPTLPCSIAPISYSCLHFSPTAPRNSYSCKRFHPMHPAKIKSMGMCLYTTSVTFCTNACPIHTQQPEALLPQAIQPYGMPEIRTNRATEAPMALELLLPQATQPYGMPETLTVIDFQRFWIKIILVYTFYTHLFDVGLKCLCLLSL